MAWKNASKGEVPANKNEVLVSVNGSNFIASFDALEKGFGAVHFKRFFWMKNDVIYWQEITPPEKEV